MPKNRRPTENGTSMLSIAKQFPQQQILLMLKEKYNLKTQRTVIVQQTQELRKKIYNLSKQINALEEAIDKQIVTHFKGVN